MGKLIKILGLTFLILTVTVALASAMGPGPGGPGHGGGGGCPTPEIDPGVAPSAIALLTGGLLILRDKFSRK